MVQKNLAFVIQRPPYKSENTTLAFTHAISSQTAEIHLEDGQSVGSLIILVGDGVLNCLDHQKAMDHYGIISVESHLQNALLVDCRVLICREDLDRFGIAPERIPDATVLGAEIEVEIKTFDEIEEELRRADHLLFF